MRNEAKFIVLEGATIVIAVAVSTVFHPEYCFPVLASGKPSQGPKSLDGRDEGIELSDLA
jgi:hypothetical protein